ncbi:MAG: hypothetical protein KAR19_06585 [Bacteroidales bacterium]|nr:hypothetical protein [Bacteroidales bacterium]
MKIIHLSIILIFTIFLNNSCINQTLTGEIIVLKDNWSIRSSKDINEEGEIISTPMYNAEEWHQTTFPTTVLGALVENEVYPDPYYGTNIKSIPGYTQGKFLEIPEESPFNVPWWYRTVFKLPADYKNRHTWIKFHSINYRANIWLNGQLIADTTEIEGAYRLYELDITRFSKPGGDNCLALEIFPPRKMDLTISWVDWNPIPPDAGMGIWYDVTIHSTGSVAIKNHHVVNDLDLPSLSTAKLTISANIKNTGKKQVAGILKGKIENIEFSQRVFLEPKENKLVTFSPSQFKQLEISNPRLWWPHTMGPQNLYGLNLTFETKGVITDSKKTRFGIREVSSWMNKFDGKRTRVFQVNGRNVVIRGGGYVEDMMLRPSKERIDNDLAYAKHMNLNTLRMEAPRGGNYIFDRCDEEGILLIVGWCCCSPWERWKNWTPHTADIAEKSWKDQIVHLRNHPSVFNWVYGSDYFPPKDVEKMYINIIEEYDNTRPYQSSATRDSSAIAGFTGLEMGPYRRGYAYMTPTYWYGKKEFNTEAGPGGEQIPPIETLRKMMPEEDLWPISDSWDIRLHKAFYPDAREALYSRYGEPNSVEEYCLKSQVLQLEAIKGMFEAYAGNKYRSSGIIYWMYNSAWPSMFWQLYDYYHNPNGAFYGAKSACEPLHIQYAYDDHSIYIVNGFYKDFNNLKASVKVYNFDMEEKFAKEIKTNIASDESKSILTLDWPQGLSNVFFLKLDLNDSSGKELTSNFYWLSTKGDENADFTDLNKLPDVKLEYSVSILEKNDNKHIFMLEIENPSSSLAFSINPKILGKDSGDPILPIYWEDNYFSLLPKEKRKVKVEFNPNNLNGEIPILKIDGWNIISVEKEINHE